MKKQELIHLHGLLAEVSAHCETVDDSALELEDYYGLGIRPTSIHQSKTDHKAAVFALADSITDHVVEHEEAEAVPTSAD